MTTVNPNEVNKPVIEPAAKSAGEGRQPERNLKIADKTAIKLSEYKDIADLFSARAENLFKENQKRSKALGTKGFDKTSAIYRQWYNTTQVVKLADKLAGIYGNTESTAEDFTKAAELEQEIKDARIALDLTREEALDEATAAEESTKRMEGLPLQKRQSAEKLVKGSIASLKAEVGDMAQEEATLKKRRDDEAAADERWSKRWQGVETPKKQTADQLAKKEISNVRTEIAEQEQADNMKKQIETAKKEADRIGAEQKQEAATAKYEKSVSGPLGWFKRLFRGKELKAADAAAKEKTELIKAAVEADAQLERKWTEEDEATQEKPLQAGAISRGLDKAEAAITADEEWRLNKRVDKIDQAKAKAAAEEAAMLKKWGNQADADLKRAPETDEQIEKKLRTGLIGRTMDKAENAMVNAQAQRMDKNLDKKLAKEQAEAAELADWKEEVDESVAKRSMIDKVLSKFERDPEEVATKKLAQMDATEAKAAAKEAAMLKKWGKQADADMKRAPETDEQIEKKLRTGLVGRTMDKAEESIVRAQTRRLEQRLGKKIDAAEKEAAELDAWKADEAPDAQVTKITRRKGKQPVMPADATKRKDIAI